MSRRPRLLGAFFGGVPQSILYDNTKLAVAQILGNGKRLRSQMFSTLQSHYLFEDTELQVMIRGIMTPVTRPSRQGQR
jgi:hypothetical protein